MESKDLAKANPEIVARLTKLVQHWKATLPQNLAPKCITGAAE